MWWGGTLNQRYYFWGVVGVDAFRQPVTKTKLFSWMELLYLLLLQDELVTLAKWSFTSLAIVIYKCFLENTFLLRPKTSELNTNDHSIYFSKERCIKSGRPNTTEKLYSYLCRYLKAVCQKDGPGFFQWSQAIGQEAIDQKSSTWV